MNPIVKEQQYERNGIIVTRHMYWCPGCDSVHAIAIRPSVNDNGAGWTWDGNLEKPTYEPSQLTKYTYGAEGNKRTEICHTFIRQGKIQYLSDCTHSMAGQTVEMQPLPDWALS